MFSSFVKTWWWKAFVFNTYPGSQVLKQCAIKSSRLHRGEFQYHGQRSTNRKTTQNIQLFMELVIIITWFYCFFLFPIYVFIVPFRRTWSSNIFSRGAWIQPAHSFLGFPLFGGWELGAEARFRNSWPTAKTVASLRVLRQTKGEEEDIQTLNPLILRRDFTVVSRIYFNKYLLLMN